MLRTNAALGPHQQPNTVVSQAKGAVTLAAAGCGSYCTSMAYPTIGSLAAHQQLLSNLDQRCSADGRVV